MQEHNKKALMWIGIGGLVGWGLTKLASGRAKAATVPYRTPQPIQPQVARPPIPAPTPSELAALDKYRVTRHGNNPWTPEALNNVRMYRRHVDKALKIIKGKLTSMFRSPRVNKLAKGKANSPHLKAKAADMVPTIDFKLALKLLKDTAKAGGLGPVQKITPYKKKGYIEIVWN